MRDGDVFAGRYALIRVVGRGAMGQVWLAHDLLLERAVAIKQILSGDLDPQSAERTLREARLAARLSHPNAVAVYDVLIVDGQPYLVMEYVPGQSLAQLLGRQPVLAPEVAVVIGSQVAAALAAAHRLGMVHRDVKPANILLTDDGTAKLADFGVARALDNPDLTRTGHVVGSLSYLAPEAARGTPADPAVDVWALGATLFRAVEGRRLFEAEHSMELLHRLLTEPVPHPRQAGPMTPLLERMLSRDASARPPAEEVRHRLEGMRAPVSALRTEVVRGPPAPSAPASPPPAVPPAAPPPWFGGSGDGSFSGSIPLTGPAPANRRRAAPAVGVAAAALVLVAAVTVAIVLNRGSGSARSARTLAPGTSSSSAAPPTPIAADCRTDNSQIIYSWSAGGIVPGVRYRVRLDKGNFYEVSATEYTAFVDNNGARHQLRVVALNRSGTPSAKALLMTCRAPKIEKQGTFADRARDTSAPSPIGVADITGVDWNWGSRGLEFQITLAKSTNLANTQLMIYLDTDRQASTGFAGIGCTHQDAKLMGVDYVLEVRSDGVRGGTLTSRCQLAPVTEDAKVTAGLDSLRVTIPRAEFVFQNGLAHVKIGASTITDSSSGRTTALQDVVTDPGAAPMNIFCQP